METSRIKSRLFWAFFAYTILIFIFAFIIFLFFKRIENFEKVAFLSHKLQKTTSDAIICGYEFYLYETTNESFWKTQRSATLEKSRLKLHEMRTVASLLARSGWVADKPRLQILLDSLTLTAMSYGKVYEQTFQLTWDRGFRDYGLMGRFRAKAHEIERMPDADITMLLQMRRHEKDYMLRGDSSYIEKFFLRQQVYRNSILKTNKISFAEKERLVELLNQYAAGFDSLVKLDQRLGHLKPSGLQGQLQNLSNRMLFLTQEIESQIEQEKKRIFTAARYATISVITISVILVLMLMVSFQFVFTKKIST